MEGGGDMDELLELLGDPELDYDDDMMLSDLPGLAIAPGGEPAEEVIPEEDMASGSEAPLPDTDRQAEAADTQRQSRSLRQKMWAEGPWGAFNCVWKNPSGEQQSGSLEARCPYHRKNDKTDCKKTMACQGTSRRDQEVTMLRLKLWCNSAKNHVTQRSHMSYHPSASDVLVDIKAITVMVEAQKLAIAPDAGYVKTDVQIHEEESRAKAAEAAAQPPAAASSSSSTRLSPRGQKRKAQAKSAGVAPKAKAQAKAKVKAKTKAVSVQAASVVQSQSSSGSSKCSSKSSSRSSSSVASSSSAASISSSDSDSE